MLICVCATLFFGSVGVIVRHELDIAMDAEHVKH